MRLVRLLTACCALASLPGFAQQPTPAPTAPIAPTSEPSARQTRAAERAYAQGVRATEKGDADAAEKAFAKAAKLDPSHPEYATDWQIARQHSVTKLIQDADKARLTGHPEQARAKLAEALALDPKNQEVAQHIDDLANLAGLPPDAVTAAFAPTIELTPKPGNKSLHFP